MTTLQVALAAIAGSVKPASQQQPAKIHISGRKPKSAPVLPRPRPGVRRVPFNTFTPLSPLRTAKDDRTGRHTESREPPTHEPMFAERFFPVEETLVIRRTA